jgi:hypothetical protein
MSFEPPLSFLREHFLMEVGLRLVWFVAPVAVSVLTGLIMLFFLMHRMGNVHRSELKFSTKGLGRLEAQDVLQTPKLPSLRMALFLASLLGGFGLFYLSILAGFAMSILTVLGLVLMLASIKAGMAVEGVLWGGSVVTAYWLWKKQSDEMWYRVHN